MSNSATVILLLYALPALVPGAALAAEKDSFDAFAQTKVVGVQKRHNIQVAYDVKDDAWDAGIGKGLYYVRGLLEAYKSLGVPPKAVHVSIVLHGAAAYWLLNEAAYQQFKNDPFAFNPNEQVVRELLNHGVSVEICYATMKGKGWTVADILPGVTPVHDAYTRLIDLQQRGYAYIRF